MSRRGITPILHITQATVPIIGLEIEDCMEHLGLKQQDHFTYTARYSADTEGQKKAVRDWLHRKVQEGDVLEEEKEAFLEVMAETGWDCTFLVDCW